jgi:glycosyltransferase involved in cell wall biosynthesis
MNLMLNAADQNIGTSAGGDTLAPAVSVIICAHNPRPDYLARVITALREQTLPLTDWELLTIDNASAEPLAERFNLSWHPRARHVLERELGLTSARLRGIAEAAAQILLFVDDDNVLDPNYLQRAVEIGREYPFLGAWGGTIRPEFQCQPPQWATPYLSALAIREIETICWSNTLDDWRAHPCGAGMCVRRSVAEAYAKIAAKDPVVSLLGRRGASLMSAEDTDIIYTARTSG